VVVGKHQPHPGQASFSQVTQEFGPGCLGLAVTDEDTQDLPKTVLGDPRGDHHGAGDDLMPDAGLEIGGIQIDVGEAGVVQRPGAERRQGLVQVGADPRDLGLGDSGVGSEGFDQVIDGAGGHAVDIGLHDDRVQSLVDAPASLQQHRVEAAGTQLGDGQFQVTCGGGERLVPVAVAVGGARVGSLGPLSADLRGGLGLDQFLQQPLSQLPHHFEVVGGT
jgi:hypothetical protein